MKYNVTHHSIISIDINCDMLNCAKFGDHFPEKVLCIVWDRGSKKYLKILVSVEGTTINE